MSDKVLVKVEGVSKKFCRSLKRSLWYGVQDVAGELLGRTGGHEALRPNEFWAVDDVSFELKRGECLGLIGPNGAGKSTLLKMLNGLVKPDKGRITMRGRVGTLIELGAGFNPILTARENIYVNGSVLGFAKKEIDGKFDAIVDFAEIAEFLDAPVQSFSSGMKVRLGFAIAAQMEPDVLLIDEVLAVGDAAFRLKCLNQIHGTSTQCATIIVSHSMPMISRVSTCALSMYSGGTEYCGDKVTTAIEHYLAHVQSVEEPVVSDYGILLSEFKINAVKRNQQPAAACYSVTYGASLVIEFAFDLAQKCPSSYIDLLFMDMEGRAVAQCFSMESNCRLPTRENSLRIRLEIPSLLLNPGRYWIQIGLVEALEHQGRGRILYKNLNASTLIVRGSAIGWAPVQLQGIWTVEGCEFQH